MGRITVFHLATCPHCQRAKALLTQRGITYHDISLTDYPEMRAGMLQLADRLTAGDGGGAYTSSQISTTSNSTTVFSEVTSRSDGAS